MKLQVSGKFYCFSLPVSCCAHYHKPFFHGALLLFAKQMRTRLVGVESWKAWEKGIFTILRANERKSLFANAMNFKIKQVAKECATVLNTN